MSRRHTDASLLAAARESVLELGLRRTSVSDVARRAGASRMTVYRTFPDGPTLWSTLLNTEFAAVIRAAEEEAAVLPTARLRLVEAAVRCVERLSQSDLVLRILEVDPEVVAPYLTDHLGQSQKAVLAIVQRYLEDGQRDGSIRAIDPGVAAYCLMVVARSFVLGARVTRTQPDPAAIHGELRTLFEMYLQPPSQSRD